MPLVECIPNVSEGRRSDLIDGFASAIRGGGAALLDVHVDAAHHRSVFTCAGQPDRVRASVLALCDAVIAAIDLRVHQGVHPRVGALDVVPFVPLAGASMSDCIALARDVGATIAARHDLPVYLYEEAAVDPSRRRLETIRRGQFEGLATRMREPGWTPDFGPARPHPTAGASVVGARHPLIAFNVTLETDRLDIARAIAATVRERSGGLRAVKALGLPLADRGVVQVSMNLTNYRETSIVDAYDAVAREAARHGVVIRESELVGLLPADALASIGAQRVKLAGFTPRMLLEHQILESSAWPR